MTTAEAVKLLQEQDVPCGPVVSREEVHKQPQVIANGSLGVFEHPVIGALRQPYPVPTFGGARPGWLRPAPVLGQHTAEVLEGLGVPDEELQALSSAGVIFMDQDLAVADVD
jgi:crotonobetainyl-CoA:carnitine CoA-transferase CaiB-like acyl-CoA transferase